MEKKCKKCNETKPTDKFYKSKNTKDGLRFYCIECEKLSNSRNEPRYKETRKKWVEDNREKYLESRAKYYEDNKDDILEKNKAWRQTFNGRLLSYKKAAKKRNISFNLTEEEIKSYWKEPCYYCGCEIHTIGLDRIDSNIGYDLDNIVPCCSTCNTMKMNLTVDDFMNHMLKIIKHRGKDESS